MLGSRLDTTPCGGIRACAWPPALVCPLDLFPSYDPHQRNTIGHFPMRTKVCHCNSKASVMCVILRGPSAASLWRWVLEACLSTACLIPPAVPAKRLNWPPGATHIVGRTNLCAYRSLIEAYQADTYFLFNRELRKSW